MRAEEDAVVVVSAGGGAGGGGVGDEDDGDGGTGEVPLETFKDDEDEELFVVVETLLEASVEISVEDMVSPEELGVDEGMTIAGEELAVEVAEERSLLEEVELSVPVALVGFGSKGAPTPTPPPPPEIIELVATNVEVGEFAASGKTKDQLKCTDAFSNTLPVKSAPEKPPQKIWLVLVAKTAELSGVKDDDGAPKGRSGLPRAF